MNNYIPLLKTKSNEIHAIRELSPSLKENLSVFFEIPRKSAESSPNDYKRSIVKAARSIKTHCVDIHELYLDVFDIPSSIVIDGRNLYEYTLNTFIECDPIPVIGIDRSPEHIQAFLDFESEILCLRVQVDDFDSFEVFFSELKNILKLEILNDYTIDILLDCRYCHFFDPNRISKQILNFLAQANKNFSIRKTIISGSSIPGKIGEVVQTNNEVHLSRVELEIYNNVSTAFENSELYLGDYTIVSPQYYDIQIPPEILQNVMAPKLIYTYQQSHYIQRGGALRTHIRGNQQFNDQCEKLVTMDFFRGADNSWGDSFIMQKARGEGSQVMPGTIIKPTVNAHITYMLQT